MPSLKRMRQRTDDIKVEWGDETVTVSWRPGMLTDRFMEELTRLYEEARGGRVSESMPRVRGKLADLIAAWDLTEEEGPPGPDNPPIAINADTLADIPEGLLIKITGRILEEAQGGEASGNTGGGGNLVALSDTSRDGPHSFG